MRATLGAVQVSKPCLAGCCFLFLLPLAFRYFFRALLALCRAIVWSCAVVKKDSLRMLALVESWHSKLFLRK